MNADQGAHTSSPADGPESFGRRIARLRGERGWTQEVLAERLALSRVAVSHFEAGLAVPSERTVVLLAGLFKQEPHELVAGSNYPEAKAERLPAVACRYTEIELQVALLQRDLSWYEQVGPDAESMLMLAGWPGILDALEQQVCSSGERAMLQQARAWLEQAVRSSRPVNANRPAE